VTTQKLRSGMRVHQQAEEHVKMLTEAGEELRKEPKVARYIDGFSRGIMFEWERVDKVKFDRNTLIRVGHLIGEIAVCDMWKRNGRIAYDLNEELAAALYRGKIKAVPGVIFDRLPHINPMVVLPDPWPVTDPDTGDEGWVRSWFVYGWTGKALCDTNDPDREGLGVLYCYDVVDEETGELVPGPNRMMIPLPTFREKFTVAEAVRFAEEWQNVPKELRGGDSVHKQLEPLLRPTLSVMSYLCCDNRDMEEPTVPNTRKARKRASQGGPRRDPFWVRVGWYIGPALHEARRTAGRVKDGVSSPSGIEYGPQHRAGHLKDVRFGPGRKQVRSQVWIQPYWTKRDQLAEGQDPVTQVVPVNPQRHDPLRRRGMKK
jgi:hypothetical protein